MERSYSPFKHTCTITLATLVVTVAAMGCGSTAIPSFPLPELDGGSVDGGALWDGGSRDGGLTVDGGTLSDGGVEVDGGPVEDGGAPDDGGLSEDGGTETDGGPSEDGAPLGRDARLAP